MAVTCKAQQERPTLVLVHSHIGYGSPVADFPKGRIATGRRGLLRQCLELTDRVAAQTAAVG
jgi:hypothetical protein